MPLLTQRSKLIGEDRKQGRWRRRGGGDVGAGRLCEGVGARHRDVLIA